MCATKAPQCRFQNIGVEMRIALVAPGAQEKRASPGKEKGRIAERHTLAAPINQGLTKERVSENDEEGRSTVTSWATPGCERPFELPRVPESLQCLSSWMSSLKERNNAGRLDQSLSFLASADKYGFSPRNYHSQKTAGRSLLHLYWLDLLLPANRK